MILVLPLAVSIVALAASQATGADLPPAGRGPGEDSTSSIGSSSSDPGARFAEPEQSGIPFQAYATAPAPATTGFLLDLGVQSLGRAQTLNASDGSNQWAYDVEVTPGVSLSLDVPSLNLAAGYAARLTFPIAANGPSMAVLNWAYLRASWRVTPLWTLGADGAATFGDNSQLQPATTPGSSGPPPPVLNPVRSFSTYPYIALTGSLRASGQLSARSRLRLSAGYFDIGGVGTAGEAAQPRSKGPMADAAWDWDASPTATLTTSGSITDNIMASASGSNGSFYILLGQLKETWTHRWGPDVETIVAAGIAASNTDSITFLTVSHLMPLASVGVRYFTDERHQFRLTADAALMPYVDTYIQVSYQRVTGNLGLDWYPTSDLFVGAYLAAAWVPYSVKAPESYGTGGASAQWALGKLFTIGAGAFTQAQIQGPSLGGGAFRQWTAYVSLTVRDREAF